MIFFFVAASIDTDVLLSVSRCAAPPMPCLGSFTCVTWELLKIRGRSNGAANLPALGSCQRIPVVRPPQRCCSTWGRNRRIVRHTVGIHGSLVMRRRVFVPAG